jgi:transposase
LHLCLRREAESKQKTKVVENSRDGVAARQVHAVLEATGVSHETTAEALHAHGFTASLCEDWIE